MKRGDSVFFSQKVNCMLRENDFAQGVLCLGRQYLELAVVTGYGFGDGEGAGLHIQI